MAERILKENMKLKLASALLFAALAFAADPAIPTVGQAAPDFTLPSQDGTRISLGLEARVGIRLNSPIAARYLLNPSLDALGEEVRARVMAHSGIELQWEIRRIGIA
jgi:hypothetical protein